MRVLLWDEFCFSSTDLDRAWSKVYCALVLVVFTDLLPNREIVQGGDQTLHNDDVLIFVSTYKNTSPNFYL